MTALLVGILLVVVYRDPPLAPMPETSSPEFRLPPGEPLVRVRLESVGVGPWRIGAPEKVEWRPSGDGDYRNADGTIDVSHSGGIIRVGGHDVGPSIDIRARPAGEIEIDGRLFPGSIRVVGRDGTASLILIVPLETYVSHVLPHEMPLYYPEEALRAQAVACRTYALASLVARRQSSFDLSDSESSQVFRGTSRSTKRAGTIVASTAREILVFDKRPFLTYFSANCGGATRSNREAFSETEIAPLAGRECGFCTWSEDYHWTHVVTVDALEKALGLTTRLRGLTIQGAKPSGFETECLVETTKGKESMTARRIRSAVGYHKIKSTKVTKIDFDSRRVRFEGYGFGHGVGLCQTGARGLAEAGEQAEQILTFYFPGAQTVRLDW